MLPESNLNDLQEPITSASPEIRNIIERILKLERNKLYQKKTRNINEDILKIIREEIQ
jgi:5'-deoxynucleotidase YfbR-like HD superfamily hydrolase